MRERARLGSCSGSKLDEGVEARRKELDERRKELDEKEDRIASLEALIQQREAILSHIYSSHGWKI